MKKIIGLLLVGIVFLGFFVQARVIGLGYSSPDIVRSKYNPRSIRANYFPNYSNAIEYVPGENYNSDYQTTPTKIKTVRLQYSYDYYGNQYIVARDY